MADEEATMPLAFEESEEQTAARLADAEADRLFRERVREAEARAAAERRKEIRRISEAMDLIERADPMLLGEVRAQRAVRNTRLVEQRPSAPSAAGLLPSQMADIQRRQEVVERQWEAERRSREVWIEDSEATIKALSAGQSEDNKKLIRAQFNAQKARG